MRKITLTFFLFLFEIGFSQSAPITFETGGQGASWTFTNFDNGPSPTVGFEKVVNPFKTGINTSETVGKYTALSGADLGGKGAGCQSKHGVDLGTFKLSYSNCTIKIMVYKTVISDVGIKFAEADGGSNGELLVKNTKINEWEELTFDFTSRIGATKSGAIDQLILFMDLTDNRPAASVSYFDDITFSKSLVPPPVVACDAVLTDALEGSFAVGYKTKFETVGTNVNITFELLDQKDGLVAFLHRESPFEETQMENNPAGTRIFTKTITGQTKGDIISYACKFAYAGGLSKTKYIKYEVGSFCDGIAPTAPTVAAPTPTATAPNVISLFSGGAYTDLAGTNWNPGWGQSTVYEEVQIAGNATKKYSNFNYQGVVLQSPVDVSSMAKLHLDVWSPDCTALKVFLIPTTGAEKSITVNPTLSGWNSFDINLADYTGVDTKSIKELKFESVTAGTTVFIDNLYFIKDVNPSLTMNAPVTFETGDHGAAWIFVNFDNGPGTEGFEKVANPSATGINTSSTVGKFTATVDGSPWAGCKTNDIGRFTLDPQNSLVKIMVYKTVISDVALKFAVAGGGSLGEIKVKNTKVNQWEELSFEFYNQIGKLESTDIVTMNISLDYQGRAAQSVSYFDNITFSKTSVPSPVQVCDAILTEASQGSFTTGYKANFATVGTDVNITFELLDQRDGLVAGLWKESPFAELPMVNEPAGSKIYKAKLTDQKVGSLISYACKFAYAGGQSVTKYIKYEVGTACTGTPPVFTGPTIPMDFESGTFAFVDFDGGAASTVDNPNKSGINTSNKVAKMVKGAGAAWAGSKIKLTSPVNFSTDKKLKVKVWSPVAGKKLLLKFEGAGAAFEKEVATTVANTWEELTFDYTGVAGVNNLNDNMVFIFDFGTVGDGSANSTYYFDDVKQASIPVTPPTNYLVSFETGSVIGTWNSFENPGQTGFEFANNPSKTGINTSDKVGKFTAVPTGQRWAGCETASGTIGTWELDATSTTVTMMVYKSVISPVAIKMATKYNGTTFEIKKNNTKINEWELMTFDISKFITSGDATMINKFVVFPDFREETDPVRNSDVVLYFDDIKFSAKKLFDPNYVAPPVENPTVAATTPPVRNAADVKSIFSDAYAVYKAGNWCQCWGQSTIVEDVVIVAGDNARLLKDFTYQGITLPDGEVFNVSDMNKVHIDIWFNDAKSVSLALVQQTSGGSKEAALKFTPTKTGWNSFDIDLNSTTLPGIDLAKVFQMKLTTETKGANVFLDNFYFWKDAATVLAQMDLPVTFDDATVDYSLLGFGGTEGSTIVTDPTLATNKVAKVLKPALSETWAGITISGASGLGFKNKIPFSTSVTTMSVRIWSPDAGTIVRLKVEDHADKNRTVETESIVTTAKGWETVVFDFAKPVSGTAALNLGYTYDKATIFFGFGSTGTEKIYYFDDVAFGAAAPEVVEEPLTAAPTPPARNVADVKSVFSGAYADIAGTSWNENWGQSTVSEEVSIVGDATKKLSNLNYQGVVPTTGIDATGMTQLHLDIWTPDCTAFDVYLINPGPVEQKVTLTPTLSGWNSFDINLSDYTTIALNNVFQFKFVSPNQNSTVYLDNMYFYKEAGVEPITGIPTNLNYGGNLRFEINKDVFSVTPTVSADPFPTFSISPDMPKGMSFDTVSGSIVGKPTEENAPISFTVTATNSVGSQQLTFTIEIFNDDHDFDGINDDVDNCSEFYNPNQEDLNNDGVGDICIEEEQVKVAQGFSPNGDGKNDAWLIKNVENHPNTHVTVFNKTGAEVFSSRDYKNLWDGSYKNTGKIVAAGSYFYQVDLGGDGSVDLQGWIYIAN